ncbi:MAG: hypothetical protein FJX74_25850 [Armatimonadetes bacterium]|nr:hypothetical protein [Armatimonadota bacterium]
MRETTVSYAEMKEHLPAPARTVVEAFMERSQAPEDVLRHLVRDEGCDVFEAYGYVREVLSRSLMELTGADFAPVLAWEAVPVFEN